MRFKTYTAKFLINKDIKNVTLLLKNLGDFCEIFVIDFQNNKCIFLLKLKDNTDLSDDLDNNFVKHRVFNEIDFVANILSWKYNLSLESPVISKGNEYKITFNELDLTDSNGGYEALLPINFNRKNLEILVAYREIKNEKNAALRFLMYYRLLECFSKESRLEIDRLIKKYKVAVQFIPDKRDKKKQISLIKHFRNKIHATKHTYRFPYFALKKGLYEIEQVTRAMISNIFKI